MHGIDKKGWKKFVKGDNTKITKLIDTRPPKVNSLEIAHQNNYEKELLFKIFDYNRLVDDPLQGYQSEESCELSLNSSSDFLNTSSESSLDISYSPDQPSEDALWKAIRCYREGVTMLKEGRSVDQGKDMIKDAAREGLPHAMYACAIITFKEVWKVNTIERKPEVDLDEQKRIVEAVEYLHGSHSCFFPSSSFVIGMMDLYNIGNYGEVIKNKSLRSWQIHFTEILLATKETPFMDRIKNSGILNNYICCPMAFVEPGGYITSLGNERGMKDMEWIIRCVEYELIRDSILNPRSISAAMILLERISSEDFAAAKCLHAFVLLKYEPDKLFPKTKRQVYALFQEAVDLKYRDAKFYFGTLPFRDPFKFLRESDNVPDGKLCFYCLIEYAKEKYNDNGFKIKAASLVAGEYLRHDSPFVVHSTQNAKSILEESGCSHIWENIEKELEKRKMRSENMLYIVLEELRNVYRMFHRKYDSDARRLSSIIKQLFYALKGSRMIIQQSSALSIARQHLNFLSEKKRSLLNLQYFNYFLEEEIDKQVDCPSKREILRLLEDLERLCLGHSVGHEESNVGI